MAVHVTMVDPDGAEWVAGSAIEITDLQALGYRIKGHGAGVVDKPDDSETPAPPEQPVAPSQPAAPAPTLTNEGVAG